MCHFPSRRLSVVPGEADSSARGFLRASRVIILLESNSKLIPGDSTMITFLSRMKAKEGKEAEFVRLAKALTEKVHENEPETTAFQFFKLRDEPRGYAVYEQFFNAEAEEAHLKSVHFAEIAPDLIECIDGTYVREYLDPME
jgi:autoinducer 2-degrading protein